MRFRPLALTSAILLAGAGIPAHVYAVSLDALDTNSTLGQNFRASVILRGSEDMTPNVGCLQVSDGDSGLPGLGHTRLSVKAGNSGWVISLRSEQRIDEPALQFTLTFNCYGQSYSRVYSVLLDLPSDTVAAPVVDDSATSRPLAQRAPSPAATRHSARRASNKGSRAAGSRKKNNRKRNADTSTLSRAAVPAPAGAERDAVKLAVVTGSSATSKREAELMAQAEDQASQLRQMELRIVALQSMIDKMRVYVPEADAQRLNLPYAASAAQATPALASAASAATASLAAASGTTASAAVASKAAASAAAPVNESAPRSFDWMLWVWIAAAVLGVVAFLVYVVRQRRIQKQAAWGNQVTEELLDSYAPVRRAELIAKMNADADAMRVHETPAPAAVVVEELAAPVAPLPVEREAAVEFVDVQHSASAVEEAQWLISHGEGERAIALLREEIRTNPDQVELWLMLFEYLYTQKKNLEFVTLAHRFRRQATGSDAWKQVCDLGLKLDPENRLFLSRNG